MDNKLENITWDNSQAYKGFDDPNMSSDLEMAEKMIPEIDLLQNMLKSMDKCSDALILRSNNAETS